jgi:hypothetical protein
MFDAPCRAVCCERILRVEKAILIRSVHRCFGDKGDVEDITEGIGLQS